MCTASFTPECRIPKLFLRAPGDWTKVQQAVSGRNC